MSSKGGTRWRSWLGHCATSGKVSGLIPVCIIRIFHLLNSSYRTRTLESTKPLTEMSTRVLLWGGGGGVNTAGAEG
jgi:hypothetical protein